MKILVTGGCGYIGSQTVKTLRQHGYDVIRLDKETPAWNVKDDERKDLVKSDFETSTNLVEGVDAVIHFAALHQVNDSVSHPSDFYHNNIVKTHRLLDATRLHNVPIIFSSTASVYGNPNETVSAFAENYPVNPMNPYARSKLAIEWMLEDYHKAYNQSSVVLRYFNAAGADPDCTMGYVQNPMSHVVPILMNKIRNGEEFSMFGDTYPTHDGTCVRDYTHVQDIADAHVSALVYLVSQKLPIFERINIGSGTGTSVKELVHKTSEILNKDAKYQIKAARDGDPAFLVADIQKAKDVLKWTPRYTLDDIIKHAWSWEQAKEHITKGTRT